MVVILTMPLNGITSARNLYISHMVMLENKPNRQKTLDLLEHI